MTAFRCMSLGTIGLSPWRSVVALPFVAVVSMSANASLAHGERQALLTLFKQTQGEKWSRRAGWGGVAGTECGWEGIECDQGGRHVVAIELTNNQLRGRLPRLNGLRALRSLRVSLNYLEGPLPSFKGNVALRELKAGNNLLSGSITQFADNPRLECVMLANNQLSGSLPRLRRLQQLRVFDVSNNQLRGLIPTTAERAKLTKVERFDLSFTAFDGT